MMRYLVTGILFLGSFLTLSGQGPLGSWHDHLSYSVSNCVVSGDNKVFSSTGASVMILDIKTGTLSRLSKANGLSEAGISALGWSDQDESLIIVYNNTNVDLVRKGIITNIPDIKNKYIPGLKEIYNVSISGNHALLSGSFGVVVVDINGGYITDTWRPAPDGDNNEVYETAILNDRIYAATAKGVYSALLIRTGLSYFGNWERLEGLSSPGARYNKIASSGSSLFINKSGGPSSPDSLFRIIPGQPAQLLFTRSSLKIHSVDHSPSGVSVALSSSVFLFSSEGNPEAEITGYGWALSNPRNTLTQNGTLWISDASVGLVSTTDFTTFSNYTLPGPYTNNVADIHFAGAKTYITGGTVDNAWGNVFRPLQVFINSGTEWVSNIMYGTADRDAMRVVTEPGNPDHYFVSSWRNGIYEFSGSDLINNFNQSNSPLSSIIPGEAYSRICDLAYDKDGNLWMTQSGVDGNLKMLKKDGTWSITAINLNVPVVGDMLVAKNNFIWVILPRGYGLLVYDPANTPEDLADDRYLRLQVEDTEGQVMSNIFSIAEDIDGNIWVGTDFGPAVYYNPGKIFDSNIKATRVKVPRNDGSGLADYLLGTETITSIAVDGANRKWFGTMSSGAYLVSADGRTQVLSFNEANSPMLSDNIVKISINGESGDVWFGTALGIISFRGDATTGKEDYSGMYVFPNPVRDDFEGLVTVTGLVEGTVIKITDISGNLVFETTSKGGQATWDLMNYRGTRVSTGVYLVFCSNSEGTITRVTKFLVIR